ncbi:hypothetical protein DB346_17050 [Verrucomicrobia bacterium LW23]|nr:hypothetical protein DB346_17050 [Verrucomicrobia bacterium LW23]
MPIPSAADAATTPPPIDPSRVRSIGVFKFRNIGDVLITTPALRVLRETYPRARITVLVNDYTADMVLGNPHVDEVLCYQRFAEARERGPLGKLCRAAHELRFLWSMLRKFDLTIDFTSGDRAVWYSLLGGRRYRLGQRYYKWAPDNWRPRVFTHLYQMKDSGHAGGFGADMHEVEKHLWLLHQAGIRGTSGDISLCLPSTAAELAWADALLSGQSSDAEYPDGDIAPAGNGSPEGMAHTGTEAGGGDADANALDPMREAIVRFVDRLRRSARAAQGKTALARGESPQADSLADAKPAPATAQAHGVSPDANASPPLQREEESASQEAAPAQQQLTPAEPPATQAQPQTPPSVRPSLSLVAAEPQNPPPVPEAAAPMPPRRPVAPAPRPQPVVVVHAVSRWLWKCWDDAAMADVVDWLQTERGARVVFTTSQDPRELEKSRDILALCRTRPIFVPGTASLRQFAALCRRADAFFGVDTAPMHIAAAAGIPVVALFGPTNSRHWGPWTPRRTILSAGCICNANQREVTELCDWKATRTCMAAITPAQAKAALAHWLQRGAGPCS